MDLTHEVEKKIKDLISKIKGVTVQSSTVVVSPEYISEATALVFETVGRVSQHMANRYSGPAANMQTKL